MEVGDARVTFEFVPGTQNSAEVIKRWWQGPIRVKGDTTALIAEVAAEDLHRNRKRLPGGGPEGLYLVTFPPFGNSLLPDFVEGASYASENAYLAGAAGRHEPLSALPTELARSKA